MYPYEDRYGASSFCPPPVQVPLSHYKLVEDNPEWLAQQQIHVKSTSPQRNGMALPADLRQKIADMARSDCYKNPRQIAKALEGEGIKVSDNTVREPIRNFVGEAYHEG